MTLYLFEHCPYCVKALMVAHYCGAPITTKVLQNDDEITPNQLVGKKIVPILALENGDAMAESLDIAKYFAEHTHTEISNGKHLVRFEDWFSNHRDTFLRLTFPRWAKLPLEEFQTKGAVPYFQAKKEKQLAQSFTSMLDDSEALITKMNAALKELTDVTYHSELTWQDVALYPFLRNLSVVKGLEYPENLKDYVLKHSEALKIKHFFDDAV